jgi:hypothetical protein
MKTEVGKRNETRILCTVPYTFFKVSWFLVTHATVNETARIFTLCIILHFRMLVIIKQGVEYENKLFTTVWRHIYVCQRCDTNSQIYL